MNNKIKLIYSATSASLGNNGYDKDLSPYAFSKAKNLEFLNNLKKWFNFKYEVIYFYNVYGPRQISCGQMATVIGIFEDLYKKNKFLPVVKPGNQRRNFTHVEDTVNACYKAWKISKNKHYSVFNKKSYSILEVAKLFGLPIKLMPKRSGERYSSALTKINLSNKVHIFDAKIDLKKYIERFKKSNL
jgi:UDP-glucose 4-epimerase